MTVVTLDPRDVAEALHIGTDDLARLLTGWAKEEMPDIDFDRKWEPTDLDTFDERVARARRYLEDAHEAMKAWNQDNPEDEITE